MAALKGKQQPVLLMKCRSSYGRRRASSKQKATEHSRRQPANPPRGLNAMSAFRQFRTSLGDFGRD
jgi:hypothetical protein